VRKARLRSSAGLPAQHHALGSQARQAQERRGCLSGQTPAMPVAAVHERPRAGGAAGDACPPIKLVYFHFHNAIRGELDDLARDVLALEPLAGLALLSRLAAVKERYQFLEQVYSIHSSVEDEVRAPRRAYAAPAAVRGRRRRRQEHAAPCARQDGCAARKAASVMRRARRRARACAARHVGHRLPGTRSRAPRGLLQPGSSVGGTPHSLSLHASSDAPRGLTSPPGLSPAAHRRPQALRARCGAARARGGGPAAQTHDRRLRRAGAGAAGGVPGAGCQGQERDAGVLRGARGRGAPPGGCTAAAHA